MEKKDIVERFLEDSIQLDASALDYFITNPQKIDEFIRLLGKDRVPIVGAELINTLLNNNASRSVGSVKHIRNFVIKHENEKISLSEYSERVLEHYEMKKRLLLNKTEATRPLSINKIKKQKEFVLIVMVAELDHGEMSAVVEDQTGHNIVYFGHGDGFEGMIENDVVMLVCGVEDGLVKVKRVVWPDVPLKRAVNKSKRNVYCVFVSDIHMDSEHFNTKQYEKIVSWVGGVEKAGGYDKIYVFILGGVSKNKEDIEKFLRALPESSLKMFLRSGTDAVIDKRGDTLLFNMPTMLEVEGIRFLLCSGDDIAEYKELWKGGTEVMMNLLKRRDIQPPLAPRESTPPSKDSLMEQTPDIFASGGFHTPDARNYKGVTIISTGSLIGEPVFWAVDLKTREINKLDFS